MPLDIAEAVERIGASGSNTVYFTRNGDGLWCAHVRDPSPASSGGPLYTVSRDRSLSEAIVAAVSNLPGNNEREEWEDLI